MKKVWLCRQWHFILLLNIGLVRKLDYIWEWPGVDQDAGWSFRILYNLASCSIWVVCIEAITFTYCVEIAGNIALLCAGCNQRRNNSLSVQWVRSLKFISNLLLSIYHSNLKATMQVRVLWLSVYTYCHNYQLPFQCKVVVCNYSCPISSPDLLSGRFCWFDAT